MSTSLPSIRRALTVVLLLAALVAAGCGKPTDPMSDADVQSFAAFANSYQVVATEMLTLSKAVADEKIPAARTSLDTLTPELKATDRTVQAMHNRTVRLILEDYMRITRKAIGSVGKLVSALEANPDTVPSRDLLAEIESTSADLKEADGNLVGRVLDQTVSKAQKRAIDRAITLQN
ncbi:hypothetical protein OM076_29645 [Solirubrobacter ginsenosidimutans]|uniref:Uncharacterized protein n=1 Tax=Solirubrobacter ginsenosidimutans TaxID=490573 RepID=A0A9X3MZE6_9ACTN|nr:hypothetical protein [Solirubrobacter ginsenosidimutans]MDA0164471.1 hypothetical protein [Solirubrobacter ginsenosidimutans]